MGERLFPFNWVYSLLLGERDSVTFPVCLFITVPCLFHAYPGMYKAFCTLVTYVAGV